MYNSNSENSQIEDGNKAQTRKSSIVAGDEVVLNENSKDIDEKTKKLLNKKIVIGIICILAIIMCVVIYSVLLSKNNNEQENELNSEAQLLVKDNNKASCDNELVFSLSPKVVYGVDNDKKVEKISLYKNKDKVAIYKRFSEGKKMFDKTFSASPYVFTTKKFIESDVYGLEESNLFIDTCDLIDEEEFPEKVVETARSLYKDALNKARNLSYSNPSKRYLVQIVSNIVKQSDENYNVYVKINSYEIAKQFFNEHISEFIIASENKSDKETEVVDYFTNPAMNAKEYLNKSNTDTLTKVVDNNGTEIINKNNSGAGIS